MEPAIENGERLNYELALVIKPQKNSEAFSVLLGQVKKTIGDADGQVNQETISHHKILAYPIEHETSGSCVFLQVALNPNSFEVLKKALRENEQILRFLFTKKVMEIKIRHKKVKALIAKPKPTEVAKGPQKKITAPTEPKISLQDLDKKLDEILEGKI